MEKIGKCSEGYFGIGCHGTVLCYLVLERKETSVLLDESVKYTK